jgi:hypothetical protein
MLKHAAVLFRSYRLVLVMIKRNQVLSRYSGHSGIVAETLQHRRFSGMIVKEFGSLVGAGVRTGSFVVRKASSDYDMLRGDWQRLDSESAPINFRR